MTKTLLLLLLLAGSIGLHAYTPEPITFTPIGLQEGLSQSTIFAIDQDRQGNLWFATYDGINKYDGYRFTTYRHHPADTTSIASNMARMVKVDSRGRVWLGTRQGLSWYDESKDLFRNFNYRGAMPPTQVNDIEEIAPNRLLISSAKGVLLFDTDNLCFIDSLSSAMQQLPVNDFLRAGNQLYIGTKRGLYLYSLHSRLLNIVHESLAETSILALLQQSPTRLWVATEGSGLYRINPKTREIVNYSSRPGDPKSLIDDYVRSLCLDASGRLWVGTYNGLSIYHEGSDSFDRYNANPALEGSLSQNSVRQIFRDQQDGMWLGTFYGGLNYYHPLKNRFTNIRHIPFQNSLNDNIVSCIAEDRKQNLWIGTNDGGVNLYNPRTQSFTYYRLPETARLRIRSNNIKAFYIDEAQDRVYIGTHGAGMSILHRSSGRMETFNPQNSPLESGNAYALLPDGDEHLWMGSHNTLIRFNTRTHLFTPVRTDKQGRPNRSLAITALHRDTQQRLWAGGERGLDVFRTEGEQLEQLSLFPQDSSLADAFVNCFHEGTDRIVWIGTRNGAYSYNEQTKELKHYTTANGLPNDAVYGILEDTHGRLWMSTNYGLSCFTPQTGTFRNFTETDGLQSNQFSAGACCRTAEGQMYFGGIRGISSFRPERLMDNPYTPPVSITGLYLFNKPVRPDDATGILTQTISHTPCITLKASQSAISLEFVVANFIAGQHNTFAYQLEGFDPEWYYLTEKRPVSYSNLPQGTYHFRVKAANNDGKWNDEPTSLKIIVLPVWYKTWWALLLFFLAFVTATALVFRYLWIRKSMKAELQLERTDKARREEMNQMKLSFFINISHELRTPLTLILAPVQEMLERVSDRWICSQLTHVQQNANRLLHLVNQLMDYRRAELGVFHLKVRKGDLHQLVLNNYRYYQKLAQHKKLYYTLHSEIEERKMLFDAHYLELIVNNLLSNAFKHTGEGKSITLTLKEEAEQLLLEVSDTGIGIPVEKQARIFERFYQVDDEHVGSGIGLSLVQRLVELHHGHIELRSEEGKGSTFCIYLPQNPARYTPDELTTGEEIKEEEVYTTNPQEMYFIDAEAAPQREGSEEPTERKRGTLLLVEDNSEIRHYLNDGLSTQFNTLQAGNGQEALDLLKENEVDILLTDVMMPVMDGIKLCKSVKQNIATCHIPVIILSAKADLKDQLEGLGVGADDYIPKPFVLSLVTAKIQNMFRTRQRTIEHYSQSLEVEPEKITFNPLDEQFIKKALAIINENMDNSEFGTDDLARLLYISRSNLHLKMKAITGESTTDFIKKVKFSKVSELLKDGRYTISEVSVMTGFSSSSYFTTSFKKYFDCLPTEYIKKYRKS